MHANEMELQPHQQRVCEERDNRNSEVSRLDEFIGNNPIFGKLDESEKERLKRQSRIMHELCGVLSERIAAFGSFTAL